MEEVLNTFSSAPTQIHLPPCCRRKTPEGTGLPHHRARPQSRKTPSTTNSRSCMGRLGSVDPPGSVAVPVTAGPERMQMQTSITWKNRSRTAVPRGLDDAARKPARRKALNSSFPSQLAESSTHWLGLRSAYSRQDRPSGQVCRLLHCVVLPQ